VFLQVGDRHSTAVAHNDLGIVHAEAGRLAAATEAVERAVELFRQLGDDHATAVALSNLGIARMLLGDGEGAVKASQGSLDLLDRLGDRHGRVRALWNLGAVTVTARGEAAAAPILSLARQEFEQLDAGESTELRTLLTVTDPAATALRWWPIAR
jgi:tetratricopeptide (TPR) repeat protein